MNRSSWLGIFLVACGGGRVPIDLPGQPPSRPTSGAVPASSTTQTFAIDHLLLGDDTTWRSLGFDLDHEDTTKDSTNVCTRAAGAPEENQVDGDDGIDNAWGANVLPIIESALDMKTPSANASGALASGAKTLDLVVTGLPADPTASALGLELTTTYDGASSRFIAAYVARGTFVSDAGDAPIALGVPFVVQGATLVLPLAIRDAVVTFSVTGDGAIAGTIAGVLDRADVDWAVSAFAHSVDPTYFDSNPGAMQLLLGLFDQTVDISNDGTNTPGVACNAISIGVGFTAHAVQ